MTGGQNSGTVLIVLVVISFLLLLLVVVGILFSVSMGRKNMLVLEQERAQFKFEQELTETQIEFREETLRNISWELHDNIGQLLTLEKVQLQNVIEKKIEIIIFRILQEFLTNSIKHPKAKQVTVVVDYLCDALCVKIADDGVGFDYQEARGRRGIGRTNIETRAKIRGADVKYIAAIGKGTQMKLTYKPQPI